MRCLLLIMDGAGVGELPDARLYGDAGSNTLGNIGQQAKRLSLPNFEKLGLGNIIEIKGVKPAQKPLAAYGKCNELSAGKDTMTGHWEMMGAVSKKAFPTYPDGFGPEMIMSFEDCIGKKVLGNKAASGTEIIKELGAEHLKTGEPIIYTSADSVFQIAAHKEVVSLDELYEMCEKAYDIFVKSGQLARVIARPFIGKKGSFTRTYERKDFSLSPPPNILDNFSEKDVPVIGIGKIGEIFSGRGITKEIHGSGNEDLLNLTVKEFGSIKNGLVFTNLVDFDTLWGHRNDVDGFANALMHLDSWIDRVTKLLGDNDILIISADHGCDPTTKGTDHTREYVPVLVTGPKIKKGVDLGIRKTFGDIGQTVADFFHVRKSGAGQSFYKQINER
ncbi:hypothetical protein LCGC14_0484550 [marine sediment metagenome]|uniref:Metalloenzyme domain-containing protein n=1 Tax=marine sediment metagenome TaxID=412755 RepID=A0A0F9UVG1_9ZZZZ|nr:phosphopentomutase [Actinomycetota bacterium]